MSKKWMSCSTPSNVFDSWWPRWTFDDNNLICQQLQRKGNDSTPKKIFKFFFHPKISTTQFPCQYLSRQISVPPPECHGPWLCSCCPKHSLVLVASTEWYPILRFLHDFIWRRFACHRGWRWFPGSYHSYFLLYNCDRIRITRLGQMCPIISLCTLNRWFTAKKRTDSENQKHLFSNACALCIWIIGDSGHCSPLSPLISSRSRK